MALREWPQFSLWPSPLIVWTLDGGGVAQLTGATLQGWLRNRNTGQTRPIAGALAVADGAAGKILWTLAPADVAEAGDFEVQLQATFPAGASPGLTYVERWKITGSLKPVT